MLTNEEEEKLNKVCTAMIARFLFPSSVTDNETGKKEVKAVIAEIIASREAAWKEKVRKVIENWDRFSCGHTNAEHEKPDSDCPGWSIEDDKAKGILLSQFLSALEENVNKSKV